MTRTRSEYRLSPIEVGAPDRTMATRPPRSSDREALAALMLDGYRNTVDDEGEDLDDALEAVEEYLRHADRDHSIVVTEGGEIVAMAFAGVYDGRYYVDPVVVAAARKRAGLGRDAVRVVLGSLASAGIAEVGATITDGNVASERLFTGLGFTRRGPWPPSP